MSPAKREDTFGIYSVYLQVECIRTFAHGTHIPQAVRVKPYIYKTFWQDKYSWKFCKKFLAIQYLSYITSEKNVQLLFSLMFFSYCLMDLTKGFVHKENQKPTFPEVRWVSCCGIGTFHLGGQTPKIKAQGGQKEVKTSICFLGQKMKKPCNRCSYRVSYGCGGRI